MKASLVAVLLLLLCLDLSGQEAELPPIVVTGTFELRQTPSISDLFALHLQRQIETRRVLDDVTAGSPFFNARFWSYIPLRLEPSSSDSSQFFTPSYLTSDYRNTARVLDESRKQSLFDAR